MGFYNEAPLRLVINVHIMWFFFFQSPSFSRLSLSHFQRNFFLLWSGQSSSLTLPQKAHLQSFLRQLLVRLCSVSTSPPRCQNWIEYLPCSFLHVSSSSQMPEWKLPIIVTLSMWGCSLCQYVSCAFIFVPVLVWLLSVSLPYALLSIPKDYSFPCARSLDFLCCSLIKKSDICKWI